MNRKQRKELERSVEKYFRDYTIEHGGKHIIVTVRWKTVVRKVSTSASPSCPHAVNQFERDVRRLANKIKC